MSAAGVRTTGPGSSTSSHPSWPDSGVRHANGGWPLWSPSTDVYTWKLLRLDLGLSRVETERTLVEMIG